MPFLFGSICEKVVGPKARLQLGALALFQFSTVRIRRFFYDLSALQELKLSPKFLLQEMRLYRGQRWAALFQHREMVDKQLSVLDRSSWYLINESAVDQQLMSKYHMSFLDPGTQAFLDASYATSSSICLQMFYSVMTTLLSTCLSKTSINGVLHRGGMFIFSEDQLFDFLGLDDSWNPQSKKVLDLGAGDGGVTKILAQLFNKVYATEMSGVMRWRLANEGFEVVPADKWQWDGETRYDLISVLNLLDRHYAPLQLLSELHTLAINSNCLVLLGLVLPVKQYVEFHPNSTSTKPDEHLRIRGKKFEEHLKSVVKDIFEPAGFELVRWTKLPYLCEGDMHKPFFVLNDAVFLLKAVQKSVERSPSTSSKESTHVHLDL